MTYVSLTGTARQRIAQRLRPGQLAIDATMGNGHDTVFLAGLVGAEGRVFGFDIQQQALANTRQRLLDAGLESRASLFQGGHEHMDLLLPSGVQDQVSAIMFNLGYLPGSDKHVVTRPETTLRAVDVATRLLGPRGIMTIVAYRGHAGGREEANAVSGALDATSQDGFEIELHTSAGPWLYVIRKKPQAE